MFKNIYKYRYHLSIILMLYNKNLRSLTQRYLHNFKVFTLKTRIIIYFYRLRIIIFNKHIQSLVRNTLFLYLTVM